MSVYIDALSDWGWRLGQSCHLIADTEEELHAFAARIGMKREWFQLENVPHYDLTVARRAKAIKYGAIDDPQQWKACYRKWKAARGLRIE